MPWAGGKIQRDLTGLEPITDRPCKLKNSVSVITQAVFGHLTEAETSRLFNVVELLRRYSDRTHLLERLQDVLRRIAENDQTDEPGLPESPRSHEERQPFAERLAGDGVQALIAAYRAGTTAPELAAKYGVSLSTVKRLLRKHGGRLKDG